MVCANHQRFATFAQGRGLGEAAQTSDMILRKHRSAQHQRFAQNYNGTLASLFTVHAVLCPVSPHQRLKIRVLGFDMDT